MEEEIWLPVLGYEGIYEVSNLGRVKSLARIIRRKHVSVQKKEIVLKPALTSAGYLSVVLFLGWKNGRTHTIHTMVAVAFLKHNRNGYESVVDHIDGIKTNNCLSNLRVLSHGKNVSIGRKISGATSQYHGVYWDGKKWRATMSINKRCINLGGYESEYSASEQFKKATANKHLFNSCPKEFKKKLIDL